MATILRIAVEDDQLAQLQMEGDQIRRSPEDIAAARLKVALARIPYGGRVVLATGKDLEALEEILGGGSLLNGADLLKKVERLAGVSFLHCRLPFTPNQLEALAEKAERQGLTVDQLVERTAPRIYEHFFDLIVRV